MGEAKDKHMHTRGRLARLVLVVVLLSATVAAPPPAYAQFATLLEDARALIPRLRPEVQRRASQLTEAIERALNGGQKSRAATLAEELAVVMRGSGSATEAMNLERFALSIREALQAISIDMLPPEHRGAFRSLADARPGWFGLP